VESDNKKSKCIGKGAEADADSNNVGDNAVIKKKGKRRSDASPGFNSACT
jgi:hypothetical protein